MAHARKEFGFCEVGFVSHGPGVLKLQVLILQRLGAVLQSLLGRIFPGDIAKHQHGADHLTVAVANRRATVGNIALTAVPCNQYRVIGQPLYCAVCQGFYYRDSSRLTRLLVDDIENLAHRAAGRFDPIPSIGRIRGSH